MSPFSTAVEVFSDSNVEARDALLALASAPGNKNKQQVYRLRGSVTSTVGSASGSGVFTTSIRSANLSVDEHFTRPL